MSRGDLSRQMGPQEEAPCLSRSHCFQPSAILSISFSRRCALSRSHSCFPPTHSLLDQRLPSHETARIRSCFQSLGVTPGLRVCGAHSVGIKPNLLRGARKASPLHPPSSLHLQHWQPFSPVLPWVSNLSSWLNPGDALQASSNPTLPGISCTVLLPSLALLVTSSAPQSLP